MGCPKNTVKFINNSFDELNLEDCEMAELNFTGYIFHINIVNYGDDYYKTNYARIKPFILSYGRNHCYKSFKEYEDEIIRVHTDGIYCQTHKDIHSENIGGVKVEKMTNVNITGLNKGLGQKVK